METATLTALRLMINILGTSGTLLAFLNSQFLSRSHDPKALFNKFDKFSDNVDLIKAYKSGGRSWFVGLCSYMFADLLMDLRDCECVNLFID